MVKTREILTLLLLARVGLGGLTLAAGYLLLRHVGGRVCSLGLGSAGDSLSVCT
jgi:hypothetical protein